MTPRLLQAEAMPKKLISPFDHVQDILASRNRTHSGKFQAVPAGTELVKDIVAGSCAAVAEAFVADGFRWAKSGLRFSRKVGPFTHIVSFRADGANTSGHYVAVTMQAQVKSSALKQWRTDNNGATDTDNVWSRQAGYLTAAHEYFKWQLLDPANRADEIDHMIATVRDIVLPAFEVCSSMQSLTDHMLERPEIVWTPHWSIDIALWLGNKQAAEKLLGIYLTQRPDLLPLFQAEYEQRPRQEPLIDVPVHILSFLRLCINASLRLPSPA